MRRWLKLRQSFIVTLILPNEFEKPSMEAQRLLHALPTGNDSGGDKLLTKNTF